MDQPITKDTVILYHAECTDGFSAAWAAWKKFGDDAHYIPMRHDAPTPEGLTDKNIYTLDFVFPEEITKDLIQKNKRVTAIDHHISAKETAMLTHDYLFDNDQSGSVLTWKYFHPNIPVPRLLNYVEDMDLWRFKDPDSRPITMLLTALSTYDFITWDGLARDLEDDSFRHEYIEKGNMIVQFQKRTAETLSENAQLIEITGRETYAANAPHFFANQVGEYLYKKHPPFAIIWSQEKDRISVSLRSDNAVAEPFDVSEVAKKFGGGGHESSAGFSFSAGQPFPWKIIKKDEK